MTENALAREMMRQKAKAFILDEFLASGRIDSKTYNARHREIGTLDDDMTRRVNDIEEDGDHDAPAIDHLVGRLGADEDWNQADDMETFAKELVRDVSERESRPGGTPESISSDAINGRGLIDANARQ